MIPMPLAQIAKAIGTSIDGRSGKEYAQRVTTDSRDVHPGDVFFAISGPRFDGHRFMDEAVRKGAVACVGQAPSLSSDRPGSCGNPSVPYLKVEDTVQALGRLAAYYRRQVMRVWTVVVAVTGSNGKTTTKNMIDHLLGGSLPGRSSPKSFNNRIGVPLTLLLAGERDRYLVCEIASNTPGEIAALAKIASPEVGVITSIGEAHLQGLRDIAGVAEEKASLLDHVRPGGFAVVNVDRREIRTHLARARHARLMTVGVSRNARLWVANRRGTITGTAFEVDGRYPIELPMPGVHHATNAVAAFAVGRWFGLAPSKIIERLGSFEPPPGRTRRIEVGGVTLIDDTYNANPASMAAAIAAMRDAPPTGGCTPTGGRKPGQRVFVMGDMLELGTQSAALHTAAVRAVIDAGIETLVAVGCATIKAAEALTRKRRSTRVIPCDDAEAAGDALARLLTPGDTVWVKGSRAMQLERVVDRLRDKPRVAVA